MGDWQQVAGRRFGLSDRELAVLQLVSEGRSNKVIAYELKIQVSTVKAHVANIMRHMGCMNRTQVALIGFCMERRLYDQAEYLMSKMTVKQGIKPTPGFPASLVG